jgi:septum formation protein
MANYILASASPRRKQLLEWAEIKFNIIIADTDESYPLHLSPEEIAIHIAQQKAQAVKAKTNSDHTIIAADTIVVLNNEIIGKPKDRQDAVNILSKLSGEIHKVITGVNVAGSKNISFADITEVEFHSLTQDQIEFYVDKYKPYDKAGAYAIQEWIGVVGIKRITGDFYNVMGLPVSRVVQALSDMTNH